ncbi:DUF1156 domain-containing protein [Mycolicibacterium mucogenicum]|uniref:DUF1156 domain-containing protein n=1 Tax=Mycolicibacterium mucogenicum TaxID=56689 RepID=UPI002269CEC3|nr:DUF1156 domain-containing protein [Mycolicibacterium mucogenicum]MCX8555422.1 DUF1156 domain-containing protein [Mycolicibacterium mucogenicum]
MSETTYKKKLIEVALPLDEINAACKADKDRKTGTIRNLHKWFAPMPLPAWRALLFAALVDDPEDDQQRSMLLDVIKGLVANGADLPAAEAVEDAQRIIRRQFPDGPPTVVDPFCGGGSTLVEAQRLGLVTFGSDLNPVPVLITKTMTEILPKVAGRTPLHGGHSDGLFATTGGTGPYTALKSDVAHYGRVILGMAKAKLKTYFPTRPGERPVAWLWARTALCPNPACGIETVLATSWWVNQKRGELAWITPTVSNGEVLLPLRASQQHGGPPASQKIGTGVFGCISCGATLSGDYLRGQGKSGALGLRLTAISAEVSGKRAYRAPDGSDIAAAKDVDISDRPVGPPLVGRATTNLGLYGFTSWDQVFTPRQTVMLETFSDLVAGVREMVLLDGGDEEWATAITALLGLAVGQLARASSTQSLWRMRPTSHAKAEAAFGRNDLPMMWDFAETYFDGGSVGDWTKTVSSVLSALSYVPVGTGEVRRADARQVNVANSLIATDPPYFDAIGYADLSDFFYVWHRRALRSQEPSLYGTLAVPKAGELTAIPAHHGNDRVKAKSYFIQGFSETFANLKASMAQDLPMIVVYASKEQKSGKGEEIRWSAILSAMISAELEITGTWPIHGTSVAKMNSVDSNVVSSYIAMVCRARPSDASTCSLTDFNRALRRELASAIRDLQAASILPVDIAQAAIGPGMQIFSRYRAVLDQAGQLVPVDQALRLINTALSEVLDEQEGELDAESRFAVRWWETYGWDAADFGEADKAARPLGISVDHVKRAQVVNSTGNKVHLLGSRELDRSWIPTDDIKPTAWEAVHHLADRLVDGGGELEAAQLMAKLGPLQDPAMALTYRLHDIAAKKGRTQDQERYNALINSWSELIRLAGDSNVTAEGLF